MKIVRLFRRIFGRIEVKLCPIPLQCERISELDHAADEMNVIEVMKYKKKAFEAATDVSKAVSDSVRKIILRCVE